MQKIVKLLATSVIIGISLTMLSLLVIRNTHEHTPSPCQGYLLNCIGPSDIYRTEKGWPFPMVVTEKFSPTSVAESQDFNLDNMLKNTALYVVASFAVIFSIGVIKQQIQKSNKKS